jgi:hypothetical protein
VKNLGIHFREILSHDSHKVYVREETGRYGEIRGRAAQRALHFSIRTLQRIKRDGTHDK